jgi:hypothetical protein
MSIKLTLGRLVLLRNKRAQRLAACKYESILFSILRLIGCLHLVASTGGKEEEERPSVRIYSPTVILRCFIVRIWFRIDSNNALHESGIRQRVQQEIDGSLRPEIHTR